MRLYIFKAGVNNKLYAFAGDLSGDKLPEQFRPGMWSLPLTTIRLTSSHAQPSRGPSMIMAFSSGGGGRKSRRNSRGRIRDNRWPRF
jgi:hypothetical protein